MTALTLPADEFSIVARVYCWLKESGHLECGGLYPDTDPAPGRRSLLCECGDRIEAAADLLDGAS